MSIYSWSLTASDNATADAGINWQEGQSPSTINNSARAMMAAIKAGDNDIAGVSILGGSGDTFTLSLSQPMVSLTSAVVGFFATRTNTGAVTLNVDSLGAKPLRLASGVALSAGQLVNGTFYQCAYNVVTQEWLIVGHHLIVNADLAPMAANTIKANLTGSSATPTDVTLAALTALIAPDNSVTNVKLAQVADSTVKGNLSGSTANPSDITLSALAAALIATGSFVGVPSGTVSSYGGSTAPSGWLECDGTAVSRTTYSSLFTAIGTTHGSGNGSTTFNVPDLRGEFVRGWDHGKGTDSGRALGTSQADDIKAHTHSTGSTFRSGIGGGGASVQEATGTTGATSGSTGNAETRPRNIALMYCIKT